MQHVTLLDTTLRDGEQAPGAAMQPAQRLEIAARLSAARVDIIEAGFPAASRTVFESVRQIARALDGTVVSSFGRAVESDIDAAWDAVREAVEPQLHIFIATSRIHLEKKLRITPEAALERTSEAVRYARKRCGRVEFSAEDATRSDPVYLARVFEAAIAAGATTVNIPDTVGYALPDELRELVRFMCENVRGIENVVLGVHTHDDLGLAVANALAAIDGGARHVEVAVNGIGERAGNCALEEVVAAIRVRSDRLPFEVSYDLTDQVELSRFVATATSMPVQKNKAIVGAHAFAHESGIHQDGMLKDRSTYEIMDPAMVGSRTRLPLGRNSGRAALRARCAELGIAVDAPLQTAFERAFQDFAETRTSIADDDLRTIAARFQPQAQCAS